jgi:hypothetical protein
VNVVENPSFATRIDYLGSLSGPYASLLWQCQRGSLQDNCELAWVPTPIGTLSY